MDLTSKPAVVMELGAQQCKLGFSTERAPRQTMLTVVGRPNGKVTQRIPELRNFYVGGEAQLKTDILNVRPCLRRGMVDSWDDMTLLWRHAYRELLRVNPEEHPVLLAEPPLVPPVNREKMTQVMFETFEVPAMYVSLQQLLTLLSVGHVTGLLLEAGFDATYVVPVHNGYAQKSVTRLELGGRELTDFMANLLKQRALSSPSVHLRAGHIKEELCYVAKNFEHELQRLQNSPADITRTYQLPDGQVISVAEERFRCPEAMFQPSLLGSDAPGLPNAVMTVINSCTPDQQPSLLSNIVLAGGSARFPGLRTRLQDEVRNIVPAAGYETKVRDPQYDGQEPSAWLGGAILASLPTFQSMWITKQEYDEEGPSIVHRKCDHL